MPQFELIEALFNSQFPNYEFLIKETLKAKDFIEQEVLFTSSLYTIPRKGKISCNITVPPLAVLGTKTLDSSNILNPDKIFDVSGEVCGISLDIPAEKIVHIFSKVLPSLTRIGLLYDPKNNRTFARQAVREAAVVGWKSSFWRCPREKRFQMF